MVVGRARIGARTDLAGGANDAARAGLARLHLPALQLRRQGHARRHGLRGMPRKDEMRTVQEIQHDGGPNPDALKTDSLRLTHEHFTELFRKGSFVDSVDDVDDNHLLVNESVAIGAGAQFSALVGDSPQIENLLMLVERIDLNDGVIAIATAAFMQGAIWAVLGVEGLRKLGYDVDGATENLRKAKAVHAIMHPNEQQEIDAEKRRRKPSSLTTSEEDAVKKLLEQIGAEQEEQP